MSKSILIINTPEKCLDCEFVGRRMDGNLKCMRNKNPSNIEFGLSKPSWCPLKEIPSKYPERDYTPVETKQYMEGYEDGYNACIENIIRQ